MSLVTLWTSLIFLGDKLTCSSKNSAGFNVVQYSQEECVQYCNTRRACNYVTHSGDLCYTWEECFPVAGEYELFQHRRLCVTLPAEIGVGLKMLHSSNISNLSPRSVSYHLQFPVQYTVADLGFPNPRPDDCANYFPVDVCEDLNGYWRRIDLGCVFILEGVFPIVEYYDVPKGINRMGWTVSGYDLSTVVNYNLEYTFWNRILQANDTGEVSAGSSWTLELATTLEITLNVVVAVAFSQSFDGFDDLSCGEAESSVEEATWRSLAGFADPKSVKVSTDCGNWDTGTRRRLVEAPFETEVMLPVGETLDFSPEVWKELMEYYLDSAILTEVTTPMCVGCDEILPMVLIDDHDFEEDMQRLSINMTITATSTAAENWKIDHEFGDFHVTSEQAAILGTSFYIVDDSSCEMSGEPCEQQWVVDIDVDAISGADAVYRLFLPMIQTVSPFNKSMAEYTLIVGDPSVEISEIGKSTLSVQGISDNYVSSKLPPSEFYIGDILEYSFDTSIDNDEFDDLTILNMSLTWDSKYRPLIPSIPDIGSLHHLVRNPRFQDGEVKWTLELNPFYFRQNGTLNLVIEGFIDADEERYGFHHEMSVMLHDLVCLDPYSTSPIREGDFHQTNCPTDTETNGVHFIFCSSLGWDLARSQNYCDRLEVSHQETSTENNQWISILIVVISCILLLVIIVFFTINYRRCKDASQKRGPEKRSTISVDMTPTGSRQYKRRGPFARNRSITGSADRFYYKPRSSIRPKRIPRWRKETDKTDKKRKSNRKTQSRLPRKGNEYHISQSNSPITQRKRQMFRLIAAIESKLAKSDVPLTPIEKVEIKLSRPRSMHEASRSRSISDGTKKRCFRQRSPSVSDSSPPSSPMVKPWRHPMTQPTNAGVTSHRPMPFRHQCSDGADSSSNASSEQIKQMNSGKTLVADNEPKISHDFMDPDYHKVPKDYYNGFDMTLLIE